MTKWRPVAGFEGVYEVSSAGHVRRLTAANNTHVGKILKARVRAKGYLRVVLHNAPLRREVSVHRLVALTFIPCPNPDEMHVNHRDGNPANNDVSNLEWSTPAENMDHSVRVLRRRSRPGSRNSRAKLNEAEVLAIRAARGRARRDELAAEYGVSVGLIKQIWRRECWKHLSDADPIAVPR